MGERTAAQFRQRLDMNVKKMVDGFRDLIKTARIEEEPEFAREKFEHKVLTASLVSRVLVFAGILDARLTSNCIACVAECR